MEDLDEEIITYMLENIENRFLWIGGAQQFIILRKVSDNRIVKAVLSENEDEINKILQTCADGELYDIILCAEQPYEAIGNVRVRYINYLYDNYDDEIAHVTLKYPQDIISGVFYHVKIDNMS